jgi:hypothetical protein
VGFYKGQSNGADPMAVSVAKQKAVLCKLPLRQRLESIVTLYDMGQCNRRGYNPYALGIYLERANRVADEVEAGKSLEDSLYHGFHDRLLDYILKRV